MVGGHQFEKYNFMEKDGFTDCFCLVFIDSASNYKSDRTQTSYYIKFLSMVYSVGELTKVKIHPNGLASLSCSQCHVLS